MGGDTSNPNQMAQHPRGGRYFKPPHLVIDKPTDMEIDDEGMDYMDEDNSVQMLMEEGIYVDGRRNLLGDACHH